jgi:hypothetical protein
MKFSANCFYYFSGKMAGIIFAICLMLVFNGCGNVLDMGKEKKAALAFEDKKELPVFELKSSSSGAVIITFLPSGQYLKSDIIKAVASVITGKSVSAAIFPDFSKTLAHEWLSAQMLSRNNGWHYTDIILIGYSDGGSIAGNFAGEIFSRYPKAHIKLLVTVDAIKSSFLKRTAGTTASIITLDKSIPGSSGSFVAYSSSPKAGTKKLLRHVNYYQENTVFLRGCKIVQATENHLVNFGNEKTVTHGNIDSYVIPMLSSDLKLALKK